MKLHISSILLSAACLTLATGCIQDFEPQGENATAGQVADAPGYYKSAVDALTSTLSGTFVTGNSKTAYDFGYTSMYLQRDLLGNDIFSPRVNQWGVWYQNFRGLTARFAYCAYPWTVYYKWIRNCNNLLTLIGETPSSEQRTGYGQAHAMRALFYMEMAQMYAPKPYAVDKDALTVPIVTEKRVGANNPRVTNEAIWDFIINDLNIAEEMLDGYTRPDVYTVDKSVVYGLKARAYLVMSDWENAEKYAKLAQNGYSMMSSSQYTDRNDGFNKPNSSWMLATKFEQNSENIQANDGDICWASWMCLEANGSGNGNASCFGQPFVIDRHLYSTIPTSDIRRNVFIDFDIDNYSTKEEKIEALKAYSDYPEWIYESGQYITASPGVGGLSVKFRLTGGNDGHNNQRVGFSVAVPMMRVEEMLLIEAEAAGMQSESRGRQLLTNFALQRDPNYVYGTHNEAYGNPSTSQFQNEIWWQRRVEFWGEGMATFDVKRLQKGIIRNYPGTNHVKNYRWNTETVPQWMIYVIPNTETNDNEAIVNNPDPVKPSAESPEHIW